LDPHNALSKKAFTTMLARIIGVGSIAWISPDQIQWCDGTGKLCGFCQIDREPMSLTKTSHVHDGHFAHEKNRVKEQGGEEQRRRRRRQGGRRRPITPEMLRRRSCRNPIPAGRAEIELGRDRE
jgi:hypothetical protein